MPNSLKKITGYLLRVETLINDKAALMDKLSKSEGKWLENDQIFKERKTTLKETLRIGISLVTTNLKFRESELKDAMLRVGEHEKALFMIDEVFIKNRVRSVLFMAEVEQLINIKKELLGDLG